MPNAIAKFANVFIFLMVFIMSYIVLIIFMTLPFDTLVTDKTTKFVNECQTTGQIDPDNLNAYLNKIYSLGYDVEITHGSLRSYPSSSGEYFNDYYDHTLNEILDEMYATTEQPYVMKYGDELTIRVTRNQNTMTLLLNWMFHSDLSGTEITRYSGKIGNSNAY